MYVMGDLITNVMAKKSHIFTLILVINYLLRKVLVPLNRMLETISCDEANLFNVSGDTIVIGSGDGN
jgi:hypothetical protein